MNGRDAKAPQLRSPVDPKALITVGMIQWSVPSLLPGTVAYYSGFRPQRQARYLDFLEVHFYPLADGGYKYGGPESEARNLAYLESVVREAKQPGQAAWCWLNSAGHAAATEKAEIPTVSSFLPPAKRSRRNMTAKMSSRRPAGLPAAG